MQGTSSLVILFLVIGLGVLFYRYPMRPFSELKGLPREEQIKRLFIDHPSMWLLVVFVLMFFLEVIVGISRKDSAFIQFLHFLFAFGVVMHVFTRIGPMVYHALFPDERVGVSDETDRLQDDSAASAIKGTLTNADGVVAGRTKEGDFLKSSIEDRAVVIGPPGTGKTAFLVTQLLDWARSGRPFVVLDIKPEIYGIVREELEESHELITYNPTAGTGHRYNPFDDAQSLEAIGELAAALVPAGDEQNAVFHETARDLLDAIVCHLRAKNKSVSLPDVREYLIEFDDHKLLINSLKGSPSVEAKETATALKSIAQSERLLGSIFATLRSNLRFLRFEKIRESLSASDFSLSDFKSKPVGLFLQFEEKHRDTTAHLFSAFIAHVLRFFIANPDRPPVLLLLDEIGNAPAVPGLIQKLNTIRSRHLPTWMYWQSKEQMQMYGAKADEGPNIILGACDLQMVFRLNDNATADWMSTKIGTIDREVTAVSDSKEHILFGGRRGQTVTRSVRNEAIIKPHELQQLASGEVVTVYRGLAWRSKAPAYFDVYPKYHGKKPGHDEVHANPYPTVVPEATA